MPAYDVEIKVTIRVDTGAQWYAEQQAETFVRVALWDDFCEGRHDDGEDCSCDGIDRDLIEVMSIDAQVIEPVVTGGDLQRQEDLIARDARRAVRTGD